jgi:VanZ family protein
MIVALIGLVFAAFDELRQSFVPGREPRYTDVLLDGASVLLGAGGLLWLVAEGAVKSEELRVKKGTVDRS